jgi:integrase
MGSLVKDSKGRSQFWYACFRSGSKRLKKSTGTENEKEAKRILEMLEHGEELAAKGKLTENRLRTLLYDTMERVTGQKAFDPTIQEWLDTWLTGKENKIQSSTMAKCRQAVKLFKEFLGPRVTQRLETVTTQDLLRFQEQLRSEGRMPATVNLLVNRLLSMPFTMAFDQGLIKVNPFKSVDSLPDRAKPEKGVFTSDQVEALLSVADIDWQGMILMSYFSGMRLGDLSRLTWANIDLNAEIPVIKFTQKKTDKKITIPMHAELHDHLTSIPSADVDDAPLFPSLCNKPVEGGNGLSNTFKSIMEKAGVASGVGRKGNDGVGRSTSTLSFHSFRHTLVSVMANAQVAPDVRQKVTGHADAKSHQAYTHHELKTIQAAIDQIPRIR